MASPAHRGSLRIGDAWLPGEGPEWISSDPGTGEEVGRFREASAAQVEAAVAAARAALPGWRRAGRETRAASLETFADRLRADRGDFAELLSRETGKPRWEALSELDTMIAKVPMSLELLERRRPEEEFELAGAAARTRYRPIGVLAVLGPFNLPGHLPNGQIVPALLAGNCVVFKPSEWTPAVGERLVQHLDASGFPPGVVNLVQGGRSVGESLVDASGLDGVLFTGSYAVGRAIAERRASRPETLLALEMGGNNPLVVHEAGDLGAVVSQVLLSAFITAGQRCTCARRLIIVEDEKSGALLDRLVEAASQLRFGLAADVPEPFAGPLIGAPAAERLREAAARLEAQGAEIRLPLRDDPRSDALLHPAIFDVTAIADPSDEETFGPLLQVVRVPDFDAALAEANRTAYGLAAALLSDRPESFERFAEEVRAGVVNWNRQTTGASGRLAFGGLGQSGNHRPAGAWAADFCSDPVSILAAPRLERPASVPPGFPELVE